MKVSDREALAGHCANVWQLATSATMSFFFGPPNPRLPLVEGDAIHQSTLNGRSWPGNDGPAWAVFFSHQTSVCSAISNASSTSIPRYLTVLSSFV